MQSAPAPSTPPCTSAASAMPLRPRHASYQRSHSYGFALRHTTLHCFMRLAQAAQDCAFERRFVLDALILVAKSKMTLTLSLLFSDSKRGNRFRHQHQCEDEPHSRIIRKGTAAASYGE